MEYYAQNDTDIIHVKHLDLCYEFYLHDINLLDIPSKNSVILMNTEYLVLHAKICGKSINIMVLTINKVNDVRNSNNLKPIDSLENMNLDSFRNHFYTCSITIDKFRQFYEFIETERSKMVVA